MNYSRLLLIFLLAATSAYGETAYTNAKGYTSTNNGLVKFSVLVVGGDGRVKAVGDESELRQYPDARVQDVHGRTLLPGLTDSHAHVLGLGQLKSNLDLSGTASVASAKAAIQQYSRSNDHTQWILGRGWNQVLWADREFPQAADIDAVVTSRPVWLRRIDGHAGWANTAAMKIAGIASSTPDPVGGKIVRDDNGNATGIFVDKAMALIDQHVPSPKKPEIRAATSTAMRILVSEGITSVHDAGVSLAGIETYLGMADDNELPLRVYVMTRGAGDDLDAIGEPIRAYGNDHLDIASVKLVADGALGSRGAAMIEPYSDDAENRGLPFWTQSELDAMVAKANGMGFQVGIHAIGDLGNRMALDAFDRAQGGKPSPLRNRIEHAQIIALEDIPRFAGLGVVAAMQSTHATSDKNMAEHRIGPERILGGYAWRRLLDNGAVIANGSDFPVELSNPFHGLYAAVTRQGRDGRPDGGWYADQAMTRAEALHSFTLAAAFAAHQEDRLGSLEPGKWADFIIIDRDYFEVPADEIDDIKVIATVVGGKTVFENPGNGDGR